MSNNKTGHHTDDGDGIGQRFGDAADRVIEIKDEVAEQVGRRVHSLEALVKEHPLAAIGIGFGIGYLIARIVHR